MDKDKLKVGGLVGVIVIAIAVAGYFMAGSAGGEKPNIVGTIKESDPAISGSNTGVPSTEPDPSTGAPADAANMVPGQ
jgi:hypothetical protein